MADDLHNRKAELTPLSSIITNHKSEGCLIIGSILSSFLIAYASNVVAIISLILISLFWFIAILKKVNQKTLHLKFLLIGVVLTRVSFALIEPYHENDYYRYIWDGIVSSKLSNALVISPSELQKRKAFNNDSTREKMIIERNDFLENEIRLELLGKINYKESPSIYGPCAQVFLAFQTYAYQGYQSVNIFTKDSLQQRISFLKISLLMVELVGFLFFYKLLIHLKSPKGFFSVLLFCPLLMKEVANSMHIDILPVTISLGVFLMFFNKKELFCAFFLACCVCVKMYGLVLLPLLVLTSSKRLQFSLVFFITVMLFYCPYVISGGEEIWAGTQYFSHYWSMNDFFSAIIRSFLYNATELGYYQIHFPPIELVWVSEEKYYSRMLSLGVFFFIYCILLIKFYMSKNKLMDLIPFSSHALFLIFYFSPVQNPWYLLWGLPFFIISKHWVYILLVALSQFYLFNFIFEATTDILKPFQWWVVFPHSVILIVFLIISCVKYQRKVKLHS